MVLQLIFYPAGCHKILAGFRIRIFFADPDPDPGKNFHADPDPAPDPDPGGIRGRGVVVKGKMIFF